MNLKIAFLIFALVVCTSQINGQCLSKNDGVQPSPIAKANLYKGEMEFTINTLHLLNRASPNQNIFFSPYSIFHALLLAYFGANGRTEENLRNALKLEWAENKVYVMHAYRNEKANRIQKESDSNNTIVFQSADRIYFNKNLPFRECLFNFFDEELTVMDFAANPEARRAEINNWISEFTKGHIQDIIPPGSISAYTNLVLANAAYFKGNWVSKFDPELTKPEIFYITMDQYQYVDMMHTKGNFYHAMNEKLQAHILEMPYDGEEMSMFIILPAFANNGLEEMLSRLTIKSIQEALEEGSSREVIVSIPKFSFETTTELVPVLQQLGVGDLFDSSKANLTGFANQNIVFDDAIHKAKIEVDENGSTAAAATVLFSFRSSRPLEPAQFKCDHPFIFFIYDSKSKVVLFTGIYRDPRLL